MSTNPSCKEPYGTTVALIDHTGQPHPSSVDGTMVQNGPMESAILSSCARCPAAFGTAVALQEHTAKDHTFPCSNCSLSFPSTAELQAHKLGTHAGTINFELGGVQYSLNQVNGHGYECPCSHHPSPTTYPTIERFVSHIRRAVNWEKSPPPEPIRVISDQLIDTPTLVHYSLVVNVIHKLLICLSCSCVVPKEELASHLSRKHDRSVSGPHKPILVKILDYHKLSNTLPNFTQPIPAIDGLLVLDARACPLCPSAYPGPSTWEPVNVQRFKDGQNNRYFRVIPNPTPQTSLNDLIEAIMTCYPLAKQPDSVGQQDARLLSPWLRLTRWHELLVGHEPEDLCKLAAQPTALEFPNLQPAVLRLFVEASALIDRTPELILQKLNSPQPTKEITNTPFHHLQDHPQKIRSYILPVVSLLAMILRGGYSPLPPNIQPDVDTLRSGLSEGPLDDSVEHVRVVLSGIWQEEWKPTELHRITDPTVHALALSGLHRDGSFNDAKLVTNVIARFEYCMRLLFLSLIHTHHVLSEGFEEYQHWVKEKVQSTFNSLRTLQHLASSIAYGTMSLPRVYWTDRKTYRAMLYKGDPVSMENVQAMIRSLEKRTRDIWEREVLLSLDLSVQYDVIKDDLSNSETNYSFFTDRRNDLFFARPNLLLETILASPQLKARFVAIEKDGVIVWNTHELRKWLSSYSKFHLDQITRTNLTAGAPSRITELTAMQICNTRDYPLRNLVAMNKHIALLVTYLKTSAITGHDRLIPHALDAFTADLVIQDLAIARPFARLAARICHSNQPAVVALYDSYLFVNHIRPFTTSDVTEALKSLSGKHFDTPFGVNGWRHISTAFRRMNCSRILDLVDGEETETVQALQSGHRRSTENRVYGLSPEALSGASEDVLPLFLDASTDWQVECRVVPGGVSLPYRSAQMSAFDALVTSGRISELSNPVEKLTKEYVDQRLIKMENSLGNRLDLVAQQLERLIAPVPPSNPLPSDLSVRSNSSSTLGDDSVDEVGPSPDKVNVESACLLLLRQLLGIQNAQWTCPEQFQAISAMLELKQDVLAILATGSGKTMLVIIPSLFEQNKITVVILPLRALMMDYVTKLTKMAVPFELYEPSKRLSGTTNLIIVTADAAKTVAWRQAIAEVNQRIPVVRQIFDETHIPATSNDFRPSLRNMSDIRSSFPTQIVLLSGTVPHAMERYLFADFALGANTLVLRTCTNRPELRYVWKNPHFPHNALHPIVALVREHVTGPDDRALIVVPYTQLGEIYSKQMGFPFYHGGDSLSDDDRLRLYRQWRSGISPTMLCTSAFGTGNDYAHVRLVVHAGTPLSMLEYVQEVSRGGRDKRPATCVLYPGQFTPPSVTGEDMTGRRYIYDSLTSPQLKCIRYVITAFIDGSGTYCGDSPENEVCGVCLSNNELSTNALKASQNGRFKRPLESPLLNPAKSEVSNPLFKIAHDGATKRLPGSSFQESTQESKRRRTDRISMGLDYFSSFKEQLSKFSNACTFCLICDLSAYHHSIFQCPSLKQSIGVDTYKAWRQRIRYSAPGICYKCHVPNGPDYCLHPEFIPGQPCQFPDLIAPLAFAIFNHPNLRQEASSHFGISLANADGALEWINGAPIQNHMSNITALFLWYAATH